MKKFLKKSLSLLIFVSILLFIVLSLNGCAHSHPIPKPVPLDEKSSVSEEATVKTVEEPTQSSGKKEPSTSDSDISVPDCDGRLIPTYDMDNRITGYRCVTDSADFECPGHRAGETWEEAGAECTCTEQGQIVCRS